MCGHAPHWPRGGLQLVRGCVRPCIALATRRLPARSRLYAAVHRSGHAEASSSFAAVTSRTAHWPRRGFQVYRARVRPADGAAHHVPRGGFQPVRGCDEPRRSLAAPGLPGLSRERAACWQCGPPRVARMFPRGSRRQRGRGRGGVRRGFQQFRGVISPLRSGTTRSLSPGQNGREAAAAGGGPDTRIS